MEIIEEAQPFFIRCIRSNAEKVNWKNYKEKKFKWIYFFIRGLLISTEASLITAELQHSNK